MKLWFEKKKYECVVCKRQIGWKLNLLCEGGNKGWSKSSALYEGVKTLIWKLMQTLVTHAKVQNFLISPYIGRAIMSKMKCHAKSAQVLYTNDVLQST